jgi:acyl-CoA reductase-like NAD-dependent aldehyde dehydrogenase
VPVQVTISPIDGSVYVERELASAELVESTLAMAVDSQKGWIRVGLDERIALLQKMVDIFVSRKDEIAREITMQMGRPISQSGGEIDGFKQRAERMLELAPKALADIEVPKQDGFIRFIGREPLGTVLVLSPWNYPYLTAVNSVVPALAAGNTVVIKHSDQTPLCAERMVEAALEAGIPPGVFQYLHIDHDQVGDVVRDSRINHVSFTGSVAGGRAVHSASAGRFIAVGLELGGKDPAYVRSDSDPVYAAENIVDGAFFNSGQSCCGIERVYVHESLYDRFVEAVVETVNKYKLGHPLDPETNLGPMAKASAVERLTAQIERSVSAGAKRLIDTKKFNVSSLGPAYMAPQVLQFVTHDMEIMAEESFGPVVGIMKVSSDEDAVKLMNDSKYGLTASIWTKDKGAAISIGRELQTGTVYMNRCDYLDPDLPWVGVKDTGRGCTLSSLGYEHLTRPKSFHLRLNT